mmetsp:Transcript_67829/g.151488  ORF Transcript_67829/g.151488 Transcript_67829/m.151488 type:complete len:326 (-) Transcript_67829:322-1299(-)
MCWSLPVTLGFCCAEASMLLYCLWRNSGNDRRNVVAHVPLLIQEVFQAFLWRTLTVDDTARSCSAQSTQLSVGLAFVIHAVPFAFALKAKLGLPQGYMTEAVRVAIRNVRCVLQLSVVWWAVVPGATALAMWAGVWPSCTTIGPHGHQIWPLLLMPDSTPFHFVRYTCYFIYFMMVTAAINANPGQHDISDGFWIGVGPFTVLGLLWCLGDEWGSVWCWFASTACCCYVVAPWTGPVVKLGPFTVELTTLEERYEKKEAKNRRHREQEEARLLQTAEGAGVAERASKERVLFRIGFLSIVAAPVVDSNGTVDPVHEYIRIVFRSR